MAQLSEELQTVALNALATTLGKPVAEIETILTGDKPDEVDKLVTDRIKVIRDQGNMAGRGKLQDAANAKVKEQFGIDFKTLTPANPNKGLTIEELLDAVKEGYKPPVDPAALTEEQVKMHPTFRTLETTLQNKEAEHKKALDDAKAEGQLEVQKANLSAKAAKARLDYGAVIPDDPHVAAAMDLLFMQKIEGVTTKQVEGKTEFWKDGKRIENEKFFPLTEEDFFKGLVESSYTTKVSPQTTSSGLPPSSGQQQQQPGAMTHFKGELPKTQDDLNNILRDKTLTLPAKNEARAYWEKQQPQAA